MATKKSFSHANPAMSFISASTQDSPEDGLNDDMAIKSQASTAPKVPMKRNPEFIEVKSKRVQLLMQPSLHAAIKQLADSEAVSVNEKIHSILKAYVQVE